MTENENLATDDFNIDLDAAFNGLGAEDESEKPTPIEAATKPKKKEEKKESKEEVIEDKVPEKNEEKPAEEKSAVDFKVAYEKLEKSSKDTQKSYHENRRQLAAYRKAVEKLKEDGDLLDSEADRLLSIVDIEDVALPETQIQKYANIWDKELEYMKKYSSNKAEIEQNIAAWKHFLSTAPKEEIDDAIEDMSAYEDDEVELTNYMLDLARKYNEEVYSDIAETGSIRALKAKYSEKEVLMQKEIDKLKKQVNKYKEEYEDYTPEPKYKLPSGQSKTDSPKYDKIDLNAFFESF